MPNFPEAPRYPTRIPNRIPEGAIDLTNRALAFAFPQDFGGLILPLSQADIWVSNDRDHVAFMRKWIMEQPHSIVRAGDQRLVQRGALVPNMLKIWAETTLPGKPIFYHEGDLQLLARKLGPIPAREDRLMVRDAMVAKSKNYQLENLAPRLSEILRDLGLTNSRELLRAFVDSTIPLIHQQLYPGKPYYS